MTSRRTFTNITPPDTTRDDEEWRDDALCKRVLPETFFPDKGSSADAQEAKAICGSCSVRNACLEWAMTFPEEYGIWGGLTPDERKELRRTRKRANRDAVAS